MATRKHQRPFLYLWNKDVRHVPDIPLPGLADFLSRHASGDEEARACEHDSRRAVIDPATLDRSRPSPKLHCPSNRPAISHVRTDQPGLTVRPE